MPYPTAEALVSRDLSGGFNEQAPAVAQESLDLGNPVELARMRALAARAAAAKGLPPQASPRSCTNFGAHAQRGVRGAGGGGRMWRSRSLLEGPPGVAPGALA